MDAVRKVRDLRYRRRGGDDRVERHSAGDGRAAHCAALSRGAAAMTLFTRWIRFSAGGTYGSLLQRFARMVLAKWLPLASSTALAVATAALNNFVWHELYTWQHRHVQGLRAQFARLMRFQ